MGPLLFAFATFASATTTLLNEKADLNGDGKADKVQIVANGTPLQAVKVTVGSASLADNQLYATVTARVIDLDPGDKAQQLLIEGTSESGKRWFTFFSYNGKAVVQALKVSAPTAQANLTFPGHGLLVLENPEGFFVRRSAWALSGSTLAPVKQPFQYVGATAKVKQPIRLLAEPQGDALVTLVDSGDLHLNFVNTSEPTWFLATAPNGLVGWIPASAVGQEIDVQPLPAE